MRAMAIVIPLKRIAGNGHGEALHRFTHQRILGKRQSLLHPQIAVIAILLQGLVRLKNFRLIRDHATFPAGDFIFLLKFHYAPILSP